MENGGQRANNQSLSEEAIMKELLLLEVRVKNRDYPLWRSRGWLDRTVIDTLQIGDQPVNGTGEAMAEQRTSRIGYCLMKGPKETSAGTESGNWNCWQKQPCSLPTT